ncbi:uncharacterized protein METZ01_LOCUS224813, partial [marine metagenome]
YAPYLKQHPLPRTIQFYEIFLHPD